MKSYVKIKLILSAVLAVIFVATTCWAVNYSYEYDEAGRVKSVDDGTARVEYTYDNAGRLLKRETGVSTGASDTDGDGVSDAEENAGPGGGDGNSDGLNDAGQANVATVRCVNGDYATLVSPAGSTLENVHVRNNPWPDNTPNNSTFPFGMFRFSINGLAAGACPDLTILLPAGQTIATYYKHGMTPDDTTSHWYEFLYDNATLTGATFFTDPNNIRIVLSFCDGKRGDDDLDDTNGRIDDIGGPAAFGPGARPEDRVTVNTGTGENTMVTSTSWCFVATAAYGASDDSHVQSLIAFRDRALLTNSVGLAFVTLYYRLSPPISEVIAACQPLRAGVRTLLSPSMFLLALSLLIGGFALRRLRLN